MNDEEAVTAAAAGVDIVTAHRPVLKAFLHDLKNLLW